jgi:MoaA/NifB/PqqE/SkfB family radical SAM enzyme
MTEQEFVAMRYRHNNIGATSVDWYIGKRCNFDCSYCVDYLHDSHSPHVPLKNMKQFVDFVYERNKSQVFWSLTGGEPTLNPDFIELCKYIKSLGALNVSITTNGTRSTKYFIDLYEYLDNITLSLHFESMSSQADKYIKKIIEIENWRKEWNLAHKHLFKHPTDPVGYQEKSFLVRFMVYPGVIDLIKDMNQKLEAAGVNKIEFRYIRPLSGESNEQMPTKKLSLNKNHDEEKDIGLLHAIGENIQSRITRLYLSSKLGKRSANKTGEEPEKVLSNKNETVVQEITKREDEWYKEDEKAEINKFFEKEQKKRLLLYFDNGEMISEESYHYNKLNFEKKSNFQGWLCWAGTKHMKINPKGDIYIGSCHVGGKRGNIFEIDKGIDMPTGPIRCPKWRCTDNLDLRVPKVKDIKYFHLVEPSVGTSQGDHLQLESSTL